MVVPWDAEQGFAAFSSPVKADCGGYSYRFSTDPAYMPLLMDESFVKRRRRVCGLR
jgi:hypothetical protein